LSSSATIRGQGASCDEAVRAAADILRAARAPLIYGLSHSSTDGQRAAVALADRLGATIDTTASEGHAPSILAMQQSGESTCSLGEVRNRADLVIYWGSDPTESHPRHMERYSLEPTGLHIPHGRADRTLVVVDVKPTATSAQADWYLPIEEGRDLEAFWTLRGLLRGIEPESNAKTGLPLADLKRLAERMKSCRFGVIFFGYGVVRQPLGNRNVEALLRLVIELNQFTRFHARRMRVVGDVSGADSVLCWQTGYPFSVNFGRGYPRYNPGEFSAGDVLARREADAVLLVGSARVDTFPRAALEYLKSLPTILLDHAQAVPPIEPTVRITTAIYGIHRHGTAYRMDEVPIPLRPILRSASPSDGEVLRAIEAAL
jgi:formylmethanofuran dehydrogenase subunit B